MPIGTASNRLVKDILFDFVSKGEHKACFRCQGLLSRDNFSIEHKEAWLDSEDPIAAFFDLGNIAFSHQKCNSGAARRVRTTHEEKVAVKRTSNRRNYTKARRQERYRRTGH